MIKVGVIRGGISSEYEVSLKTGGNVLFHLRGDKLNKTYKAIDILIDKDGIWHIGGKPVSMEDVFNSVDVIFNGLHGDFGEDGKVQQMLDQWKIPYTGSGAFASALGYNKILAKEQFTSLGVKTPNHIVVPKYEKETDIDIESYAKKIAKEIHSKLAPSWIAKPLSGGSSVGMKMCKTYPELISAFLEGVNKEVDVLVEEIIEGKEATVGVINDFRNKEIYVLPPIEIRIPKDKSFFDFEAKYEGKSLEICPGVFSRKEKDELERLAVLIHSGLNLDHYSRSDFIIHPKKGIYALEVNTLPGLTDESLIPKMLNAVGADVPSFIDHIIKLALKK
ncbi:ATP-grasp domain-containing protein [Candidatus Nomurabacteria bacterium]|nr:ATP-grasp domain-containing protein [Candidatus Nomurabacteria bacterium]